MIHDRLRLGLDTYLVLLEDNNLGDAPTTLGGGERWYTPGEQAQRREKAYSELHRMGVYRGRIDDEFMETIQVLQRPGIEYYTYTKIDGRSVILRTASIGRDAVLAVRVADTIDLYPGEPERLPEQLVNALPQGEPATVQSLSCRYEDYQAAMTGTPVPSSQSGRQAKMMARWIGAAEGDYGELYAAVRTPKHGPKRAESVPRWFTTERGRILAHLDAGGYLTLVSGSNEKMASRLRQMEAELRGR